MQSLIVVNVGQVVASGQEIMRVVPEHSKLEIEAYVKNRDIGFVSLGQEAVVKVEAFPFTRYGSIRAHVSRIARDAIPEPDASAIEGDPARAPQHRRLRGRRAHPEPGVRGGADARPDDHAQSTASISR